MLYKETVTNTTLELIIKLQKDTEFKNFILVGGTALALQIGHRISVDIDFFTRDHFNTNEMLEYLEENYDFKMQFSHKNTLKGIIHGVFVDFITHDYKEIASPVKEQNIIMASKPDIAAMKVNAITGDGTRVKDFIDIYFLLEEYEFSELISFYKDKYQTRNDFHAVKSLAFFDDIIQEEWPEMIKDKDLTLDKIQNTIIQERDKFLESYT